MYDENNLYVYSYSDFEENYVFMETKYNLSDVKKLEKENEQLKKQIERLKLLKSTCLFCPYYKNYKKEE